MGILGNSGKLFQYYKRNEIRVNTSDFHSGMNVTEFCVLNDEIGAGFNLHLLKLQCLVFRVQSSVI